ncbi:P-loop NTPase fold protein [Vibrio fluvialis]
MNNLTFELRDEFNRQPIATNIIKLLDSPIRVSPLVIDGHWGTGKSEFCHKLCNLLKKQDNYQVIYIDAYKSDHLDEPLITIMSELLSLVPEKEGKRKRAIQKAIPALRFILKTALKAGASHILRQNADDVLDSLSDEIQGTTDKAIDASVERLLRDNIDSQRNIEMLQDVLRGIAKNKSIIICIDELDRCRPSYSVDLLETIKHVFDVDGVQFLLVTNWNQLKASINHSYGQNVDANKYLDKFVSFRISLPETNEIGSFQTELNSYEHYTGLIKNSEALAESVMLGKYYEQFNILAERLIRTHNLSLREVETFVRHLEIFHIIQPDKLDRRNIFGYNVLHFMSVFISGFMPGLTESVIKNTVEPDQICEIFNVNSVPDITKAQPEHYVTFTVMLALEITNSQLDTQLELSFSHEDAAEWEGLFHGMFKAGHGKPQSTVKILRKAIIEMQLYG